MIIWLASYPRSGNTYIRIILHHAFVVKTYSVYNDKADIATDKATREIVGHEDLPENFDFSKSRQSDDLYFIKTHKPYIKEYENDKIIYIVRDGREATVSYFYYLRNYNKNKYNYMEIINGYPLVGSWGEHFFNWQKAQKDKILLLHFEKVIKSPRETINQIRDFAGLIPIKYEVPAFAALQQANPNFFRSGGKDSYKKELSKFEQKYFWLLNGQAMRDSGYVNNVPTFSNQRELEKLFLAHTDLIQQKKLKLYEDKIRAINQQLSNNNIIIQNNDSQLKQKNAQLEAKEQQLANKNITIQKKNQQIQDKIKLIQNKDDYIQQINQQTKEMKKQLDYSEQQKQEIRDALSQKDNQLEHKEQQVRAISNSWSFKVGKIIMLPLSILKKIVLRLK